MRYYQADIVGVVRGECLFKAFPSGGRCRRRRRMRCHTNELRSFYSVRYSSSTARKILWRGPPSPSGEGFKLCRPLSLCPCRFLVQFVSSRTGIPRGCLTRRVLKPSLPRERGRCRGTRRMRLQFQVYSILRNLIHRWRGPPSPFSGKALKNAPRKRMAHFNV